MPALLPIMLFIFIGIPLVEIYLLIEVGSAIGALATIFAVVFTAVLGVTLIRIQGFSTIQKAQKSMAEGKAPAMEMFEGMLLLLAAICLLMPGFFTDSIGFLLLVPPFRRLLGAWLISSAMLKSRFSHASGTSGFSRSEDFFEGSYEDLTPKNQQTIEGKADKTDTP